MPRWSYILGGLITWTAHFSGLYAIASLEAQTPADDQALWLGVSVALSIACAAACALLAVIAWRRLGRAREGELAMLHQLALLGACLALIAIAWQSLAMLVV